MFEIITRKEAKVRKTLTSSTLIAQIRKPPDVAQPHGVPDASENEIQLAAPPASLVLSLCRLESVAGGDGAAVRAVRVHLGRLCGKNTMCDQRSNPLWSDVITTDSTSERKITRVGLGWVRSKTQHPHV